jgi:hypothetical protein
VLSSEERESLFNQYMANRHGKPTTTTSSTSTRASVDDTHAHDGDRDDADDDGAAADAALAERAAAAERRLQVSVRTLLRVVQSTASCVTTSLTPHHRPSVPTQRVTVRRRLTRRGART